MIMNIIVNDHDSYDDDNDGDYDDDDNCYYYYYYIYTKKNFLSIYLNNLDI